MMKRVALIGLNCPRRCARSIAYQVFRFTFQNMESTCCSEAGFHHGSIKNIRDATVKFNATPPALRDTKKIGYSTESRNVVIASFRFLGDILPKIRRHLMPPSSNRCSMISKKLTNCENTIAFADASFILMMDISSINASTLVLHNLCENFNYQMTNFVPALKIVNTR